MFHMLQSSSAVMVAHHVHIIDRLISCVLVTGEAAGSTEDARDGPCGYLHSPAGTLAASALHTCKRFHGAGGGPRSRTAGTQAFYTLVTDYKQEGEGRGETYQIVPKDSQ